MPLRRRHLLQAAAALAAPAHAANSRRAYPIAPGLSFWMPELAPAGPVAAIVNLHTQHTQIYRNGIAIGYSSVSTGKRGYGTPVGRFQVLEKQRFHRSSTYNNAPMPWMVRLTWSGIAFHAGPLPGYPASHGCIRLPARFAPQFFGAISYGDTVAVLNHPTEAFTTLAPIDPQGRPLLQPEMLAPAPWWSAAPASSTPAAPAPLALLASLPQQRLFVMQQGHVIAAAPLPAAARQHGPALTGAPCMWHADGYWMPSFAQPGDSRANTRIWQAILPNTAFGQRLRQRLTANSTLTFSDLPAAGDLHLAAWRL